MTNFFIIIKYMTVGVFVLNAVGLFSVKEINSGVISVCFAVANYLIFFGR